MSVPTFIVGTGRCGSTMLSTMLREHPKVLSLSEFFSMITDGERLAEPFSAEPMDGRQFWSIMSAITPMPSYTLRHRVPCDEFLYPCDSVSARYSRETGVPAILVTTLPFLTDDHDLLFDVVGNEVASWQADLAAEHYRRMFGWLADRFGKRLWVERSGTSLGRVETLVNTFPDARFIHIARDGRDAAISMQKHPAFALFIGLSRLQECLGVDPLASEDRTNLAAVPEELLPFLPERFDPAILREFSVPLQVCGSYWAQQVGIGLPMLDALPAERLQILRYEDILADPKGQLGTLAHFLGPEFIDEDWSARCAATVRKPRSTWRDLPKEEARVLTEACRPGFELLRAAGLEYKV